MADTKISALSAASALAGTEVAPVVQSASTVKATIAQIKDYVLGLANTFTATQTITPAVNTEALTVSSGSLTGSNASSGLSLAYTWNTSGTPTAIKLVITDTASNAASLFMDLRTASASVLSISKGGAVIASGSITIAAGASFLTSSRGGYAMPANGTHEFYSSGFALSARFTIVANAAINFGAADAASPVAQTLGSQGSRSGTDSNVAGANLTVRSGIGTGNSTGSSLVFQTPLAVASGTGAQTSTTRLTLGPTAAVFTYPVRTQGYTVATLPAGTVGDLAYVTDALTPAFLTLAVGGGAIVSPVFFNGANWVTV